MIKRSPADFQVEEFLFPKSFDAPVPEREGEGAAEFTLYRLAKESLSTPEAAGRIARELKLKPGAVVYAGLKDKHARTIQHITIKRESGTAPLPHTLAGEGWTLERLAAVPRALASSDIERNRFSIVARNLTEQDAFDMGEAAELLAASPRSLRIVNYFGDQRFGSARHGQGFLAKFLIKGDFETALKLAIATEARKDRMQDKTFKRTLLENWGRFREVLPRLRPCAERRAVERLANSSGDFHAAFCALPYLFQQLSIYAYQSHLWNSIARRLVEQLCAPLGQVIAADDPFGELLFPSAKAIPAALASLDLPLLARKTVLAEPWKDAAESVLKEEGIEVSELQVPGVRRPFFGEEPRKLFIEASEFEMSPVERDESATDKKRRKRTVRFSLPRGAYATVVLRALGQ